MPLLTKDPNATDQTYLKLQSLLPRHPIINHVEELYNETSKLLDKKFVSQCKADFHAGYAEMYFSAVLQNRCGYKLTHPSDKGPDFYIPDLNSWVEVVSVTDGEQENQNSIPRISLNEVTRYPETQVILRLCNAFDKKVKDMTRYRLNGTIKACQPIIICISGGRLTRRVPMYPVGGYPQIIKALFPIGNLTLLIGKETGNVLSHETEHRESVRKITSSGYEDIGTTGFLDEVNKHISAVMYSYANAANPIEREHWGCDFFIVHNPNAENPLPPQFVKCGIEYLVTLDSNNINIEEINHRQL